MNLNLLELKKMSNAVRFLSVDAVQNANSGHPGMPLGMADVATVLYNNFLHFDPLDPTWINRDRLILSAGHGCMLLYSILYLTGYKKITLEAIQNFRQINFITSGHPEIEQDAGVEVTTGPLGHGISNAVGMAIAEKHLHSKYEDLINHKIYTIVGDGCLMEGISYESLALAGHLNLNNLIVIWDNNSITIDGNINISSSENQIARFKAIGFETIEIDGHNYEEIFKAFEQAQNSSKPIFIAAKTKIGFGSPTKEGKSSSHGSPLGEEEIQGLRKKLDWHYDKFIIPDDMKKLWEDTYLRNKNYKDNWQTKFNESNNKQEILNFFNKNLNNNEIDKQVNVLAQNIINNKPNRSTRLLSQDILSVVDAIIPNLIGGTADLAASVMSKSKTAVDIIKDDFSGKYINFGVREHAMGGIVNGLAAYGGFIPYGGTFLVFSDFMRPAIRLAALQNLQSIFLFSHDSIALGEDGPTHQPVETLASLRLIPNLEVIRPCDGIETIEAWNIALSNKNKPTAILLSRQNLPTIRSEYDKNFNKVVLGGYVVKNQGNNMVDVNLIASGSEVSLALEVSLDLLKYNINSKVISMPSLGLFKKCSKEYINEVLGKAKVSAIIEAAIIDGYCDIITGKMLKFGIPSFGKSGKAEDLYNYFGLNTNEISKKIREEL